MSKRLSTAARPMSKSGRMGTTLQRPPTGARLGTARPGTKSGVPAGTGALSSSVHVADRPMTQQGLTGVKTGALGPQRQVQDASFYSGVLRAKVKELKEEITKLEKEGGALNAENATYLTFERRAETMAQQLKERQGELADYNLLIDKINTNTDVDEIAGDCGELQAQNNRDSKGVELLFGEKREKEQQGAGLEQGIRKQREATNSLLQELDYETQNRYMQTKEANFNLQQKAEQLQSQLDTLNEKEATFQAELESNPLKQRAFEINRRISELVGKRTTLKDEIESESQLSPEEEKAKHLKQVKEDNQEISGFESRIRELRGKIEHCQEEISRCEDSIVDQDSDQAKKYKELKKREDQIEDYLSKHGSLLSEEKEAKQIHEENIVKLLEAISTGLSRAKMLPSVTDFKDLKDDLEFKATEADRAKDTLDTLETDKTKLKSDFNKLEQLEAKINSEMVELQDKIAQMNEELEVYSDTDKLKQDLDKKRVLLAQEREKILGTRDASSACLKQLQKEHDTLKGSLSENETFTQLQNLEKKWQHIEQNNQFMKDFIAAKAQESDYLPIKSKVKGQISEINTILQQNLTAAATIH